MHVGSDSHLAIGAAVAKARQDLHLGVGGKELCVADVMSQGIDSDGARASTNRPLQRNSPGPVLSMF